MIGFDRIEPFVLQLVGFDLLDQADAAAFLRQVNQHAAAFAADHIERHVKLVAAIAAERFEQVAGEAGRMQPHQRRGRLGGIADHVDQRLLRFVLHAVGDDRAVAVTGGQLGLGLSVDELLAHAAVANQLLDRDDRQVEFVGESWSRCRGWRGRRLSSRISHKHARRA